MGMQHEEALHRLQILIGEDLVPLADSLGINIVTSSGKTNKGWAGHTVERYLGIPLNSSQAPNLGSWELKVVSAVGTSDEFRIKETMKITRIDPVDVDRKPFEDSHLLTKLSKLIAVVREHTPDNSSSKVLGCFTFQLENSEHFRQVKEDYETVQRAIRDNEVLTGKMGVYIQPRTNGPGHGSTSRAFYARKNFVHEMLRLSDSVSAYSNTSFKDCPTHAGKRNAHIREDLDDCMRSLPLNQSGEGRHKCPYCAYEAGYRDGMRSTK